MEIEILLARIQRVRNQMLREMRLGNYTLAQFLAGDVASLRREIDGRFDVTTLQYTFNRLT